MVFLRSAEAVPEGFTRDGLDVGDGTHRETVNATMLRHFDSQPELENHIDCSACLNEFFGHDY